MTLEELLEAMRALIAAAEEEGEPMSEEDMERYEQMEKKVAAIRKGNEIKLRQAAYEAPRTDGHVHVATVPKDDTLDRAFDHYMRTGQVNQDLQELRAQSVGTDSAGGFTVPETFRQKLIDRQVTFGGVAEEVEVITTSGGEDMRWPTIDDTANEAEIVAEATAPVGGADLVFGESVLGAFRYIAPGAGALPLRVSVELLQDSAFDIQALVTRKLGERIARKQADDWVNGTGTTEPFGLVTSTGPSSASTGAAPTFADMITAVHSVDPGYRSNAVFTFNDATLATLRGLVDGNNRPLWLPQQQSGLEDAPGGTLLGHRVVIDQAWADYTDATTNVWGAFGNLREGYIIRRVRDLQVIVNPYSRANEGQVEYTVWARADGVVQDPNAFVLLENAI